MGLEISFETDTLQFFRETTMEARTTSKTIEIPCKMKMIYPFSEELWFECK